MHDKIFSHIVTTDDILAQLRESIQLPTESQWSAGFDLIGIRVESLPTNAGAMVRVRELRQQGYKVQLLLGN